MNAYDKWKKYSSMYWWVIILLTLTFIVTLVIRIAEFATGIAVIIILVGSGVSILVLSLLIIRYLLNMAKPGKRKK